MWIRNTEANHGNIFVNCHFIGTRKNTVLARSPLNKLPEGYPYAEAVERAQGIHVPPRAQYIRAIMLEVERLHSHLLNIGLASHYTRSQNNSGYRLTTA